MSSPARVTPLRLGCFLACIAILVVHQAFRWDWLIEDAAICFAYARNLVEGNGLVPSPGGERVEAISDPTWVALLAGFQALGLDGFTVAKPLALVCGVGTLWTTWRLAERAMPDHAGPGALIAPLGLAISAQWAIWSASGLENALFGLLSSAAVLRTVREVEEGGPPWSAVLYLLVAFTRPEGLAYAAVGGAVYLAGTRARGWRPATVWAAIVLVPFALVEAARIAYFAWPLPNTFYAKVTARDASPLNWSGRGWNQLRDWSDRLWHGYFTPIYALGLTGLRSRRAGIGLAVVGALALSLLWPGTEDLRRLPFWPDLPDPPRVYVVARLLALVAAGALLPALALGGAGGRIRALCGWTIAVGLGFSIYADGDWMGGYRFTSLVAPELAVLFAVGVVAIADAVESRLGSSGWDRGGWLVAAVAVGLLIPPNLWQTRDHITFNQNETPAGIRLRVDYLRSILRRTFHDGPVANLDIDQGAFLWWAPDFHQLDLGMLVDVPMARHRFQQRPFVREYVFDQEKPTFINVGRTGFWVEQSGLKKYPEFDREYFETPGYRSIWGWWFVGLYAQRDLVMADRWDGTPGRRVGFDWELALEGWEQPAPWVPGREGYLEAPFSVHTARPEEVAVVGFLSTGGAVVASFSLPMGYGFYPMKGWAPDQVFRGRHAIPVPRDLPPGTYDLGFVLTGPRGRVIPAMELPPGAIADPPVLARGEVRFPDAIRVVTPAAADAEIQVARDGLSAEAAAGDCERAESDEIRLRRHRPVDWAWQDALRPEVGRALAECWAARAEHDPRGAVDALARAHWWDRDAPTLARVGEAVGDRLYAEGLAARDAGDWDVAWDRFSGVLRFQPWRAWARRWAEEARDRRLGLVGEVRPGASGYDDAQGSAR